MADKLNIVDSKGNVTHRQEPDGSEFVIIDSAISVPLAEYQAKLKEIKQTKPNLDTASAEVLVKDHFKHVYSTSHHNNDKDPDPEEETEE